MTYVQYAEPYPAARGDRFGATAGRSHPHRGQDTAPGGLPQVAVATGTLVRKFWSDALGHVAVLAHADGKYSGYGHGVAASQFPLGAVIARGQTIGVAIGATGTSAAGRHLHYTIGNDIEGIISGHVEDPLAYIAAHSDPETHDALGALYTATAVDGIPGLVFYKLLQTWAAQYGGYTGPIDGVMGANSWRGVQVNLARESGYTGPLDGIPGPNTWRAVQRWAARHGYTGAIDGLPGPNTWRAIARALNGL